MLCLNVRSLFGFEIVTSKPGIPQHNSSIQHTPVKCDDTTSGKE